MAYKEELEKLNADPVYKDITNNKFIYFNTVTREDWPRQGRITEWIRENKLWDEINKESFSSENDRVMICGSEDMTNEIKQIFEKRGCTEGSTKVQGGFVIEKAFAEK